MMIETDGLLTFKIENTAPVALDDLALSLAAFADFYRDYITQTGNVSPETGPQLFVQELRTGSVIAVLQAIADQGHLIFGDGGLVQSTRSVYDQAQTIAAFMGSLNDVMGFFLNLPGQKDKPTKKQANQIIEMLEPVAKDRDSGLSLRFNNSGDVTIREIHYHYTSADANAAQNNAKRFLGPSLPSNQILKDELLILHQVRGEVKSGTGDRGIIESVSNSPVKLLFASDEIKREILNAEDNPFQKVFVVDVNVKTANEKPALYKILAVTDSFEKP